MKVTELMYDILHGGGTSVVTLSSISGLVLFVQISVVVQLPCREEKWIMCAYIELAFFERLLQ